MKTLTVYSLLREGGTIILPTKKGEEKFSLIGDPDVNRIHVTGRQHISLPPELCQDSYEMSPKGLSEARRGVARVKADNRKQDRENARDEAKGR